MMKLMKVPRHLLMLIALTLCLAQSLHGQEASDAGEEARQLASAANDDAVGLEERQESLRKLEESARLFLSVDEKIEAARVLNRAGRLQLILHRPQDATANHSKALDLLRQTPDTKVEVDSLNGLGAAYILQEKKKREAEDALQRAILLSEADHYDLGRAQALLTLSDIQNTYDHSLALETAQRSLTLWETLDDKPGIARARARIGQYYMALNMLPESTNYYQQALNLWRELNNLSEQAEALINLGYIEHRRGEWSNAISFYTQAQGLLDERTNPEKMGQIASGLGAAFNEYGMSEVALAHFQRALEYYRQAQHSSYKAYTIRELGATYYLLGKYPEAIAHLQEARSLVDDDTLEAECDEYLGRVYIATGKYELALEHLQAALPIYVRASNPKEEARVRALMGQIAEQRQQTERARQYYQLALRTFDMLSDRINQAAVYYALGQLELKKKNYDAAQSYLRQSIDVTENIRRVPTSSDLTAAFSATVYERYEKYIECLMRKHEAQPERGLALRAFETSELARSRSLTELLRSRQTNLVPGLDPKLAEQEKSLRQSLRVKEDYKVTLLSRTYQPKEELAKLEAELKQLETELEQLETKYKQVNGTIQAQYPSYEQITRPAAWSLQQIQEEVVADDQTVLLEYSLGADRSYVWAVTRNTIASYDLPAQAQIDQAAEKVYKLLATPPDTDTAGELTTARQELGQMVLSPVAAELNKNRIIIVADGALNYIPFQALPSPSDNNQLLVDSCEVTNTPSASLLGELRREAARRQSAPKVLAAFGDPVFDSNYALRKETTGGEQLAAMTTMETERWRSALRDIELNGDSFDPSVIKPLRYARRELISLRDVVGEDETFMAMGFAATREQLLNTDLTQYAILHFATHGLLDPKRPENSGLVLSTVNRNGQAQNGFVGLQDIYQLRAPVNLVVLSACQTGLGKEVRGEGLIGLTRGFMYAGASTVVASLWKVDDEATAELMKLFYSNLLQRGMTPAEALRAAQNSIRREGRSPYYWAGFTLQGEHRQIIKSKPMSAPPQYPKIIAGGLLLAALMGGAWWYRQRRMRTARERG